MARRRAILVMTLAVLALVLVGAYVGHGALVSRLAAGNQAEGGQKAMATPDAGEDAPESSPDDASAPALMLSDHDATVYTELGEPLKLSFIADGKPLVINFWATWCPYCVDEMPDFLEIWSEYGESVSFVFLDVADGRRERVEDAAAWLEGQGLADLPVYYDSDLEASTSFGAYALPTTVVVSGDGEILTIRPGRIDPDLMREALESLS